MSNLGNREKIGPSLIYAPQKEDDEWIFQGLSIDLDEKNKDSFLRLIEDFIADMEEDIESSRQRLHVILYDEDIDDGILYRSDEDWDESEPKAEYSSTPDLGTKLGRWLKKFGHACLEEEEDYPSASSEPSMPSLDEINEEDVRDTIEELERNIERLRLLGIPLTVIVEFVAKYETISRLYITDDLRILLPDYDKEVEMPALYKALYILFVMNRKNRTTRDHVGIVYLLTNELYEREHIYKYGITINPFQRKRVQNNSVPPVYALYDIIVMFSKSYKEIEKRLEGIFKEKSLILETEESSSKEWIRAEEAEIVEIYKQMLSEFPGSEMCYQGKRYKYEDNEIKELKIPNCRLDFLGILDGDQIKCIADNKTFTVKGNGILVKGEEMSLSTYMKKEHPRKGLTNEHNGYQAFTYKGESIYEMWQHLVKPHKK
jgi:hypothetical protein